MTNFVETCQIGEDTDRPSPVVSMPDATLAPSREELLAAQQAIWARATQRDETA